MKTIIKRTLKNLDEGEQSRTDRELIEHGLTVE
jgi:hypothetical protein